MATLVARQMHEKDTTMEDFLIVILSQDLNMYTTNQLSETAESSENKEPSRGERKSAFGSNSTLTQ